MDLLLLCGIAISLLGTIISFYFFQKKRSAEIRELQNEQRNQNVLRGERLPNRTQIIRNQRNRLRNSTNIGTAAVAGGSQQRQQYNDDEENENDEIRNPKTGEKLGAKKRAKLEAKAEKRMQREAEIQLREEKKKKEIALEEQRKIQEQKAEEKEKKLAEAERLAKEEKERKEHEEYLKMKENFSVEDEGCEEDPDDEVKMNLLQEFIQHIKSNKVVLLEDVASHFKIKTQQVIDRITELCENGTLTGVIDDRGKFIYISEEELSSIAKFIKQRGRVSILELVENSCDLINLSSINTVV